MIEHQAFNPLTEAQSLLYLQAMDIPVWVDREAESLILEEVEVVAEAIKQESAQTESVVIAKTEPELITQTDQKAELESEQNEQALEAKSASIKTVDKIEQQAITSYLKMVNWKTNPTADRSLLIICRHQIDQPAHSFAQPSAPSKFMQDYIQAIEGLLEKHQLSVQIQLAHLTEAGLGNDNAPMGETVNQLNPDLILLLGEESIRHLFNQNLGLAQCRGKLHQVKTIDAAKAIASYHPFSLISEPPLKKLAFEDIALACQILREIS